MLVDFRAGFTRGLRVDERHRVALGFQCIHYVCLDAFEFEFRSILVVEDLRISTMFRVSCCLSSPAHYTEPTLFNKAQHNYFPPLTPPSIRRFRHSMHPGLCTITRSALPPQRHRTQLPLTYRPTISFPTYAQQIPLT